MAARYCVFLRGINVNGNNIKMDELKQVFLSLGLMNAQTILATGNVLITVPEENIERSDLKLLIEKRLSESFKYDAHVILFNPCEISSIVAAARTIKVPENCHLYVLLGEDPALPEEISQLFAASEHTEKEALQVSDSTLFWIIEKGLTLQSAFGTKVLGSKKYQSRLTSRNINTIEKVHKVFSLP